MDRTVSVAQHVMHARYTERGSPVNLYLVGL